jgi:SHS2 domain-containing protein
MTFETFEHTADIGLRVRTESLDDLFAEAGRAFFSLIVANPEAIRPVQQVEFELAGSRRDDLFFDWLSELLYTFATRRLLLAEFDVRVRGGGLSALARGEPLDRRRHELDLEVKAITYHGLKVEQAAGVWLAEVIVDI